MTTITKTVRGLWPLVLFEGIVLVVLGVAAILLPPLLGFMIIVLLGWLLLMSGAVGLVTTLLSRGAPGFAWSLLSALLTMLIGAFLFAGPPEGMTIVALALAGFLFLDGVFSILVALEHRRHMLPRWMGLLAAGAVDLLLALAMVIFLPHAAEGLLGLIVGLDMAVSGGALIVIAADLRKA